MTRPLTPDRQHLADLIARSLDLADALGLDHVGIGLNSALERLTGEGIPPRG